MLDPKDVVRLRHMIDAGRKAAALVAARSRDDLDLDETLLLALTRLLEIFGEAAKAVSEDCRAANPHVGWRSIAGMRDRLIHAYFDVDRDIIWRVAHDQIADVVNQLEGIFLNTRVKQGDGSSKDGGR
ncbi:MAG: DUF86 domain-containing protein [Alphaproteobacteria bacterium]|nr:DUF86 domain-containing protein [Alphaproteobacteria bacterium]